MVPGFEGVNDDVILLHSHSSISWSRCGLHSSIPAPALNIIDLGQNNNISVINYYRSSRNGVLV